MSVKKDQSKHSALLKRRNCFQ